MSIYSNYTSIFKNCVKNVTQGKKQPKSPVEFYISGRSGRMTKKSHSFNYGEGTWF